jgi:hypothetical protein
MGYDDLKVIEAKKFLVAVTGGERRTCTIHDAHAVSEVISAATASAETGAWQKIPEVPDTTYRSRSHDQPRQPVMTSEEQT